MELNTLRTVKLWILGQGTETNQAETIEWIVFLLLNHRKKKTWVLYSKTTCDPDRDIAKITRKT